MKNKCNNILISALQYKDRKSPEGNPLYFDWQYQPTEALAEARIFQNQSEAQTEANRWNRRPFSVSVIVITLQATYKVLAVDGKKVD